MLARRAKHTPQWYFFSRIRQCRRTRKNARPSNRTARSPAAPSGHASLHAVNEPHCTPHCCQCEWKPESLAAVRAQSFASLIVVVLSVPRQIQGGGGKAKCTKKDHSCMCARPQRKGLEGPKKSMGVAKSQAHRTGVVRENNRPHARGPDGRRHTSRNPVDNHLRSIFAERLFDKSALTLGSCYAGRDSHHQLSWLKGRDIV